jgi:methanogenic corrinoid protein MtbC1
LLEGDVQKSWLLIAIYIEEGHSSTDVYTFLIEAMYEIGKRWQENKISVADEHLATATCDYVITSYHSINCLSAIEHFFFALKEKSIT